VVKTFSGITGKIIAALEKDVIPYIGGRPVAALSAPEVLSVCRRIEARGAIDTTHRVKGTISQVYGTPLQRVSQKWAVHSIRGNYPPRSC